MEHADQAFGRGLFQEAKAGYEEYLRVESEGTERWRAWNRLVVMARDIHEDFPRAVALLEAMRLEFGLNSQRLQVILMDIGDLAVRIKDRDRAVQAYRTILDMDRAEPDFRIKAFRRLASVQLQTRDFVGARATLEAAIRSNPVPNERQVLSFELGRVMILAGMAREAEEALAEAASGPRATVAAEAKFALAGLALDVGDGDRAGELCLQALEDHPNPLVVDGCLKRAEKMRKQRPTAKENGDG
ncbi:MAG: tetratricopeptide repeat protein [Deltaproteobacteria bacterium]|nr:tetratricopeptide repeat protein [Deltaproteobacteria bacterium]